MTTINNWDEVINAMTAWENIRTDKTAVSNYLNQGNRFTLNLPHIPLAAFSVNIYPGIFEGALYMYIVPSSEDQIPVPGGACEGIYRASLELDALLINVDSDDAGIEDKADIISHEEALIRTTDWSNSFLRNQYVENTEIFQAFAIPTQDLVAGMDHEVFMALYEIEGVNIADLVIANFHSDTSSENEEIDIEEVYHVIEIDFDLVRPVPPFPPLTLHLQILNYVLTS